MIAEGVKTLKVTHQYNNGTVVKKVKLLTLLTQDEPMQWLFPNNTLLNVIGGISFFYKNDIEVFLLLGIIHAN